MKKGVLWIFILLVCFSIYTNLLTASSDSDEVRMTIKKIFLDPGSKTPVVILESRSQGKFIPIWIGKEEATSIAIQLEQVEVPRPNTHDLIRNILDRIGAKLHHITITDLRNNTYFAVITLKLKDQEIQLDSRPSDAIAVALRMKAPIFASTKVLSKTRQLPSHLKERGEVLNILGFYIQELSDELALIFKLQSEAGVLVADVEEGSAASKAGFLRGDVITRVNDKSVTSVDQLESFIKETKKAGRLKMEVEREGKSVLMKMDSPY
ncbi:MAG: DUF151 domain-containing protein [Candidatus Binatia bacterium]|nr:DUF151 domain-containing protein [Candidatus Binatia bacterium]